MAVALSPTHESEKTCPCFGTDRCLFVAAGGGLSRRQVGKGNVEMGCVEFVDLREYHSEWRYAVRDLGSLLDFEDEDRWSWNVVLATHATFGV